MVKEKEKLILLESHKIFLALEFLKAEDEECLTPYGKGLLNGLLEPDTFHKMPVVLKRDYEKLKKKYDKLNNDFVNIVNQKEELQNQVLVLREKINKKNKWKLF